MTSGEAASSIRIRRRISRILVWWTGENVAANVFRADLARSRSNSAACSLVQSVLPTICVVTGLLWRQRTHKLLSECDPVAQGPAARTIRIDPHKPAHRLASDIHGRSAAPLQSSTLLFLADSEHESANLDTAEHVPIQHPAVSTEHLLLGDASAFSQGRTHSFGQVRIMRHATSLRGPLPPTHRAGGLPCTLVRSTERRLRIAGS